MMLFFLLSPIPSHSAEQLYEQLVGEATGVQCGQSLYKYIYCGAVNHLPLEVYYRVSFTRLTLPIHHHV